MKESADDSSAIGVVLLLAISFSLGVWVTGTGRDSDQKLIASYEQEISTLKMQLAQSNAKLDGYISGRR